MAPLVKPPRRDRRPASRRLQDLAQTSKTTVKAGDDSPRGRKLLAQWDKHPGRLDVIGVDDYETGQRIVQNWETAEKARKKKARKKVAAAKPAAPKPAVEKPAPPSPAPPVVVVQTPAVPAPAPVVVESPPSPRAPKPEPVVVETARIEPRDEYAPVVGEKLSEDEARIVGMSVYEAPITRETLGLTTDKDVARYALGLDAYKKRRVTRKEREEAKREWERLLAQTGGMAGFLASPPQPGVTRPLYDAAQDYMESHARGAFLAAFRAAKARGASEEEAIEEGQKAGGAATARLQEISKRIENELARDPAINRRFDAEQRQDMHRRMFLAEALGANIVLSGGVMPATDSETELAALHAAAGEEPLTLKEIESKGEEYLAALTSDKYQRELLAAARRRKEDFDWDASALREKSLALQKAAREAAIADAEERGIYGKERTLHVLRAETAALYGVKNGDTEPVVVEPPVVRAPEPAVVEPPEPPTVVTPEPAVVEPPPSPRTPPPVAETGSVFTGGGRIAMRSAPTVEIDRDDPKYAWLADKSQEFKDDFFEDISRGISEDEARKLAQKEEDQRLEYENILAQLRERKPVEEEEPVAPEPAKPAVPARPRREIQEFGPPTFVGDNVGEYRGWVLKRTEDGQGFHLWAESDEAKSALSRSGKEGDYYGVVPRSTLVAAARVIDQSGYWRRTPPSTIELDQFAELRKKDATRADEGWARVKRVMEERGVTSLPASEINEIAREAAAKAYAADAVAKPVIDRDDPQFAWIDQEGDTDAYRAAYREAYFEEREAGATDESARGIAHIKGSHADYLAREAAAAEAAAAPEPVAPEPEYPTPVTKTALPDRPLTRSELRTLYGMETLDWQKPLYDAGRPGLDQLDDAYVEARFAGDTPEMAKEKALAAQSEVEKALTDYLAPTLASPAAVALGVSLTPEEAQNLSDDEVQRLLAQAVEWGEQNDQSAEVKRAGDSVAQLVANRVEDAEFVPRLTPSEVRRATSRAALVGIYGGKVPEEAKPVAPELPDDTDYERLADKRAREIYGEVRARGLSFRDSNFRAEIERAEKADPLLTEYRAKARQQEIARRSKFVAGKSPAYQRAYQEALDAGESIREALIRGNVAEKSPVFQRAYQEARDAGENIEDAMSLGSAAEKRLQYLGSPEARADELVDERGGEDAVGARAMKKTYLQAVERGMDHSAAREAAIQEQARIKEAVKASPSPNEDSPLGGLRARRMTLAGINRMSRKNVAKIGPEGRGESGNPGKSVFEKYKKAAMAQGRTEDEAVRIGAKAQQWFTNVTFEAYERANERAEALGLEGEDRVLKVQRDIAAEVYGATR